MADMDIHQVLEYLPQRFPILMIDRVLECEPGKRILALKNVSANEPYFPGHFPHRPVMPGVLILEAMAQAAAILAFRTLGTKPDEKSVYYYAGIDNARFKRLVEPGDQLADRGPDPRHQARHLEIRLHRARRRGAGRGGRHPLHRAPGRHRRQMIHPHRDRRARRAARGERRRRRLFADRRRRSRSARARWIGPHVVIEGRTRIGRNNRISQFASIGGAPQDKKYAGEDTAVEIGDGNTIREYVTINRGTMRRRARDARRQRQLDHGLRALRARLPDRQPHHLRQRLRACRPRAGRRLGDPRRRTRWCTSSCASARTASPAWAPTSTGTCRRTSGRRATWRNPTASTPWASGGAACRARPSTRSSAPTGRSTAAASGQDEVKRELELQADVLRRGARASRLPQRLQARLHTLVPADAPVHVGMVAAEASGDLLAAHLIAALKARRPELRFSGIGGPKMIAQGFESHVPMDRLGVRGYAEVLRHYREIIGIRRRIAARMLRGAPGGVHRRRFVRLQPRPGAQAEGRGHSRDPVCQPLHLGVARLAHRAGSRAR